VGGIEAVRNPAVSLFRTFEEFFMNPGRLDKAPDKVPDKGKGNPKTVNTCQAEGLTYVTFFQLRSVRGANRSPGAEYSFSAPL
jgi:hypothetical protein